MSFGPSWFWAELVLGRVGFGPTWFGPSWFWAELTQELLDLGLFVTQTNIRSIGLNFICLFVCLPPSQKTDKVSSLILVYKST